MEESDFSYITPRYLGELQPSVLVQTADQLRQAAAMLGRNPSQTGDELRTELMRAVGMIEKELGTRDGNVSTTAIE